MTRLIRPLLLALCAATLTACPAELPAATTPTGPAAAPTAQPLPASALGFGKETFRAGKGWSYSVETVVNEAPFLTFDLAVAVKAVNGDAASATSSGPDLEGGAASKEVTIDLSKDAFLSLLSATGTDPLASHGAAAISREAVTVGAGAYPDAVRLAYPDCKWQSGATGTVEVWVDPAIGMLKAVANMESGGNKSRVVHTLKRAS
jgi:hypothetical protein